MRSCVVFLSDEEGLEKKLKDLAEHAGLKNVSLGIDNPAGPKTYKIAKEAEVTVVLYVKGKIKANHAFRKGELTAAAIEAVLADVPKLVAKSRSEAPAKAATPSEQGNADKTASTKQVTLEISGMT
jgi:hypothetical protein